MSFLTAGEDEVRAWTIRRGEVAQGAAGKIHSDIARGFIRAEVIPYEAMIQFRTEAKCREAGKLPSRGKGVRRRGRRRDPLPVQRLNDRSADHHARFDTKRLTVRQAVGTRNGCPNHRQARSSVGRALP